MTQKDLIPISSLTAEELHRMTTNGGIQSGIVRKEKARQKKIFERIFEAKVTIKQKNELIDQFESDGKLTGEEAICLRQFQKALSGDFKAYQDMMNRVHGSPVQYIEQRSLNLDITKYEEDILRQDAKERCLPWDEYCKIEGLDE